MEDQPRRVKFALLPPLPFHADGESLFTLEYAVAGNQYIKFTVAPTAGHTLDLRGARVVFKINRLAWWSAKRYAVCTSVGNFSAAYAVYASPSITSNGVEATLEFNLPFTGGNLTAPVEFRIYCNEVNAV